MRRLALLGLFSLSLTSCGFNSWDKPPFFAGKDPYAPNGNTENMRRSRGEPIAVQTLTPMGGNMWPGPLPPTPSMADMVKQERNGQLPRLQPLPGQPPSPTLPPPQGSLSAPPPVNAVRPVIPPIPNYARPGPGPSAGPENGQVVQTPTGPGVVTNGTGSFKSVTLPNGQTGIVVPNGNGTSTIIMSNGQVQTIPSK